MNRQLLVADLQQIVRDLVEDLHVRLDEDKASHAVVHGEFETAKKAGRTDQGWEAFREDYLTQVAVAWVLSTVFVRFVEDNQLCDEPWLAGSGLRLQQARDRYTAWIKQHPRDTDREYLLHVFESVAKLPGLQALLGKDGHSFVWRVGPTADGARELREFWNRAEGNGLRHDFADPAWDTRFLGDLYQHLSEHAKDKYALLQTPDFVEEFILDRTLEPALAEFGLKETRLIDPACGSGHFLLGAFARLFQRWQRQEPATAPQVLAQRALDAVAGVDLNPFAVAIAKFRLLLVALKAGGVKRLRDAFDFRSLVVNGDSLLHGPTLHSGGGVRQRSLNVAEEAEFAHVYDSEDRDLLRAVLGRRYHAVVGNPPYIIARDKALNALYRLRYPDVCHRKYSLGVPFTALLFELARFETVGDRRAPGYVGMITANSFMRREFGKPLIENYLPRVELNTVLDLSGMTRDALPGHSTSTAILCGRPRHPSSSTVRVLMGKKGEPIAPRDPSRGVVWTALLNQFSLPGSDSDYFSCVDMPRERLARFPWSIGGGGAADLRSLIESGCEEVLGAIAYDAGFAVIVGEDDVFTRPGAMGLRRMGVAESDIQPFCHGDSVRDWSIDSNVHVIRAYDSVGQPVISESSLRCLWPWRAALRSGLYFGKTKEGRGMQWWEYAILLKGRLRDSRSLVYAEVATHNHFVLDRGRYLFDKTAPVVKLPSEFSDYDCLGIAGLANSSTACFWMKQVCFPKDRGEQWTERYALNTSNIKKLPIPRSRPSSTASKLDELAQEIGDVLGRLCALRDKGTIDESAQAASACLASSVAVQEELDWECYVNYGLIGEDMTYAQGDLPRLQLGERAFEIVLARQLAGGKSTTTWFERHGSTPITEIPAHWPKPYRDLVQRRIECIEKNADVRLIEQPEFKRRWNVEPFAEQLQRAQRSWLLDRMEDPNFWSEPRLLSTARFADLLHHDADFVQVANLYRGSDHYDFGALVRELVEAESVPFLPVLRYKPTGLRKRAAWERTWDLQRDEDAGKKVGPIDVPPKYVGADFLKAAWWSLRGKLDVPKERFVSYPHAERGDDPSPVFTWAGFDHLQQAKALAAYLLERREQDGWAAGKLIPLYAGLRELIPWLKQWHNDIDPESQQRLGDYFAGFLDEQLRGLGLTEKHLIEWAPPARGPGRRRGKAASATPAADEEPDS
jgi:hypothetical protein